MKDRDKFDLFLTGARGAKWTQEMVDEFMQSVEGEIEDLEEEMNKKRKSFDSASLVDTRELEVIDINGDGDGNYKMTIDVSTYLPLRNFEVEASLNNGVLEITFESE